MNYKHIIITLLFTVLSATLFAQQHELLITKSNNKTVNLKAGDNIRLSYPAEKLNRRNNKNGEVGIRGKIDSIGKDKVWIKGTRRQKNLELNIKDIIAIKKASTGKLLLSLIATYAVIGGGVYLATTSADLESPIPEFGTAIAIFPALLISNGIIYPAKPKQKVGQDYKIDVITVY